MSNIKSVIAGLGVVAGFGVAILPLATYADDDPTPAVADGESTITANIYDGISLELVSSGSAGDKTMICDSETDPQCSGEDQIVSTTILPSQADLTSMYTDAYVSTNNLAGFTLTLVDADDDNSLATTSGATIAAISSQPVGGSNPGWAVKIDDGSTWYAVPADNSGSSITVKTVTNPGAVTVRSHAKVTYGVAASSTQAPGLYRDTVTYTATTL